MLILNQNLSINIISNYISLSHALTCVLTNLLYIYYKYNSNIIKNIIFYVSTSYFSWDTLKMIINKEYNNTPYLYHHFVCFYMLYKFKKSNNKDKDSLLISDIFLIGELSNIFNYLVYHIIHKKYSNKLIHKIKLIQFIWFFYFRVYYMSKMIYKNFYTIHDRFLAYNLFTVYLMGIFWGSNQLKSILKYYLN
jgi:hypothetical protein